LPSAYDETPVYYINFAELSHTPNDFSLTRVRVPSKPTKVMAEEAKNTGTITLSANVQLVFPVGMLHGLIKALQAGREIYEKSLNSTVKAHGVEDE
jgi:hypothetical protein